MSILAHCSARKDLAGCTAVNLPCLLPLPLLPARLHVPAAASYRLAAHAHTGSRHTQQTVND